MKECRKCLVLKPHKEYSKKSKSKDGLQTWCKSCVVENKRQWIKENRDKVKVNVWYSKYRLREQDVEELLRIQDNRCGICREEFTDTPCVDHDHSCCSGARSCGKCVRGLLCSNCNKMLGGYEYIVRMPEAKNYLGPFV
jgi:hypothetical protein